MRQTLREPEGLKLRDSGTRQITYTVGDRAIGWGGKERQCLLKTRGNGGEKREVTKAGELMTVGSGQAPALGGNRSDLEAYKTVKPSAKAQRPTATSRQRCTEAGKG